MPGLVGINAVHAVEQPRKKSTLDQIYEGLQIANQIVGTGAKVYGAYQEGRRNDIAQQQADQGLAPYYMVANPGEKNAHAVPGGAMDANGNPTLYVPRPKDENPISFANFGFKKDEAEERDASNLSKSLDVSTASSRSPLGKAANNFYASQRIQTLGSQYGTSPQDWNKLTPQQVYELARSADSLLSQTGATIGGTEHLLPKSAMGDFNSFKNYIMNDPSGAGMGGWVKSLMDTASREGELARQQVNAKLDAVAKASAGGRLAKSNPNRYNTILEGYREGLLNLQKPIEDTSHSGNTQQSLKPGDVVDGHRYMGGNPNDPKSWAVQ